MTKKSSVIPMAALVLMYLTGVRGLASHRMNTVRRLSCHNPSNSAPLSYAIDSSKLGSDFRAAMPQNLTLPVLLSDEELISQIQPPVSTTGTTTRSSNILKYAWRKIKGSVKVDKEKIAKMGIDFSLTYNMISNINGSVTLSTAWYIASMKVRKKE